MLPAPDICERARQARDPRFDGRFYIAVLTTGIYCRPVCPARMPASANVRFYPNAAAAQQAGFRPCLRCRPEQAVPLDAAVGPVLVQRAVRRINDGALDRGSVAALAAELGVSARHLDRVCQASLGTGPKALASTRRLQLAKRLIDETMLPFTEVAAAAGYSSIRRFNDAIRKTWARSPRQLRALRRPAATEGGLELQLAYREPFDWRAMLDFLGARALPGLEGSSGQSWWRMVRAGDRVGRLQLTFGQPGQVRLQLDHPEPAALGLVLERVRRMFDLATDSARVDAVLAADSLLAPLLARGGGVRLPGSWDPFELAVRAICGQQVSVAGATTAARRLAQALGEPLPGGGALFPDAQTVAAADVAALGLMPGKRADAIRGLAQAVLAGTVPLHSGAEPAALRQALVGLPGIGPWTAHYISMRGLMDPDAFPDGDLVLRQRSGLSARQLVARAEAWRPWRAYAVMYLWRGAA